HQVGGRVVAHGVPAHTSRHLGADFGPRPQRALLYDPAMHYDAANGSTGVLHLHEAALPMERTLVAHLTAAFGVERCLVENDLYLLALPGNVHYLLTLDDA